MIFITREVMLMSRKSNEKKRCVCCPACGGMVFKGTVSESEHICPKCGMLMGALVKNGIVLVYDPTDQNFEEPTAHGLSSYLENLHRAY
jgi:acetyl-CoA carboxylase beta subunit